MEWKRPTFYGLLAATSLALVYTVYFVFMVAPTAQEAAGGVAQKIFYFHVPSAYAMYLGGVVCLIASAGYLLRPGEAWNAWARAGAEVAVIFGVMVLVSGPLWARKAWGVYWTWDPRLTTSLLSVLVYVAVVVLRAFTGDGEAERKFAAAFGVIGTFNLPIIHASVRLWGGNHPTVVTKGGGGVSPAMGHGLLMGFIVMTLLAIILLWTRARLAASSSRWRNLRESAITLGLED